MSTDSTSHGAPSDLREFHAFIGERLKTQGDSLTPEDALDLWRDQYPVMEDAVSVRKAVRQALDDMANSDTGTTLEEFDRQFRAKHGLPPIA